MEGVWSTRFTSRRIARAFVKDDTNKHPIDAVFLFMICPMRLDTLVFGTSFCIKRAQISLIKFHFSSTAGTMNLIISRADGTRTHREERRICTVGTILVAKSGVMSNALFNTPRKSSRERLVWRRDREHLRRLDQHGS